LAGEGALSQLIVQRDCQELGRAHDRFAVGVCGGLRILATARDTEKSDDDKRVDSLFHRTNQTGNKVIFRKRQDVSISARFASQGRWQQYLTQGKSGERFPADCMWLIMPPQTALSTDYSVP